ncbi:hypothetical protein BBJ28_00005702 [Nothophytophthora sp. Chile5]|nr:hypothetical protein BBJ28_00005702 [Nothophytophthora sp. Chile5]
MRRPLLALLLAFAAVVQARAASLRALDGFARPVAWWVVLKLPAHVRSPDSSVEPTPCDCPPPDCSNVATADWPALEARATGLCYLYADADHPTFRHFRDLGYDCLGQGGDDPVSHTLKQKGLRGNGGVPPYWALFNDQLNGLAGAVKPPPSDLDLGSDSDSDLESDLDLESDQLQVGSDSGRGAKRVCGGGDQFSAHAKGAVGFRGDGSGGFFLQTSTPNFPDPTPALNDSFVRLGCQLDNNVQFAQHLLALSLGDAELRQLGEQLQLARLCSGNFYRNQTLHDLLASAEMYADGPTQQNSSVSAFYHALLDPELPEQQPSDPMKAEFRLKLQQSSKKEKPGRSSVFEPLTDGQTLVDYADSAEEEEVLVLVKSPRAAVPPWALVAETLQSDMSVASWWDGSYGIPTICAGDSYLATPHKFCMDDPPTGVRLDADGSAPYNIENLLRATYVGSVYYLAGILLRTDLCQQLVFRWQMRDGMANLTWQLVGGQVPDGNHAKWGLTTPRSGHVNVSNAYVTFGDLNMEGFPCSKTCNGSQAGRGGSFFSLLRPKLHQSLTDSLVSGVCRCSPPSQSQPVDLEFVWADPVLPVFEELRMCHHGCIKKLEKSWEPTQLPILSANASKKQRVRKRLRRRELEATMGCMHSTEVARPNLFQRNLCMHHKAPVLETYRMLGELGKGAFGIVEKVEHLKTQKLYAMKTVTFASGSKRHEFEKEMDILRGLHHPIIVRMVETYEDDHHFYIIMELSTGGTFMLLSNKAPFYGATEDELIEKIFEAKVVFSSPEWDSISPEAKTLIRKLLDPEPTTRYTATQVLAHPWIKSLNQPIPPEVYDQFVPRVKAFCSYSPFQRAALVALAFCMSSTQIRQHSDVYNELNVAHVRPPIWIFFGFNGILTLQELQQAPALKRFSLDMDKIYKALDQQHEQGVNLLEFVAATLSPEDAANEEQLRAAFEILDRSDNDAISQEDLVALLGHHFDAPACHDMIKRSDADKDGKIGFQDFVKMMKLPGRLSRLSRKCKSSASAEGRAEVPRHPPVIRRGSATALEVRGAVTRPEPQRDQRHSDPDFHAFEDETVVQLRAESERQEQAVAELQSVSKEEAMKKIQSFRFDLTRAPSMIKKPSIEEDEEDSTVAAEKVKVMFAPESSELRPSESSVGAKANQVEVTA